MVYVCERESLTLRYLYKGTQVQHIPWQTKTETIMDSKRRREGIKKTVGYMASFAPGGLT
jgi:hypothetical protein